MKARFGCRALTLATTVAALLFILLLVPPATAAVAFDAVPTEGKAPLGVQFTDRTGPNPSDWRWEFGDNATSTLQNPTHRYTSPGTYTARLTARFHTDPDPDSEGSIWGGGTHEQVIVVTSSTPTPTPFPSRTPVVDFSFSPQRGTAPLLVEFEDGSYDPVYSWRTPYRWEWDFGDGSSTMEGRHMNHTFTDPKEYTVRLTVYFSEVDPPPTAVTTERTVLVEPVWIEIDAGGDLHRGDTVELTGSTNLAAGQDLLVTILPSSFRSTDKSQTGNHTGGVTGTTRVVAGGGMLNTFRFTADTSGFRPDTYTATVQAVETDGTATTTFDLVERSTDGPTTNITTVTTTPTTPPTTTPTTPPIAPPTLETVPPGSPPAADFTWAPDAANGLRVLYTDTSTGSITSWRWEFGDETTSTERNPIHVYPDERRNYIVRLTVEGPGGTATTVRTLRLDGLDTPPVTPTVTETTVPPTVTEVTVTPTDTGGGGGDGFPWWVAAVVAVGLLAGGVAVAKVMGRRPPTPEERMPHVTIEAQGGMRRPNSAGPPRRREAEVEIEVRGGMRRER